MLCDIVHLFMLSKAATIPTISRLMFLRCSVHSVLLILESCANAPVLSVPGKQQSPEELSGVLGRTLFTWVNPILLRGYNSILTSQDLPPLSQSMKPESTRKAILKTWAQRCQ
jgi:hypothetical protein